MGFPVISTSSPLPNPSQSPLMNQYQTTKTSITAARKESGQVTCQVPDSPRNAHGLNERKRKESFDTSTPRNQQSALLFQEPHPAVESRASPSIPLCMPYQKTAVPVLLPCQRQLAVSDLLEILTKCRLCEYGIDRDLRPSGPGRTGRGPDYLLVVIVRGLRRCWIRLGRHLVGPSLKRLRAKKVARMGSKRAGRNDLDSDVRDIELARMGRKGGGILA